MVRLERRKIYTLEYTDDVMLLAKEEDKMIVKSMIEWVKIYLERNSKFTKVQDNEV